MSNYTTQLRYLVENNFDLGLQDYPMFEFVNFNQGVDYREQLNNKIIEHYYFREIGLETPALFKRFLNRKMTEIMPYYNQLYASCDVEFNPLWNVDLTETFTHTITDTGTTNAEGTTVSTGGGTGNSTVNNSNTNTVTNDLTKSISEEKNNEDVNVMSDTPQGSITEEDIIANAYASAVEHNKNNSSLDNQITDTGTITTETIDTVLNNSTTTNHETINANNDITNSNTRVESYTKNNKGSSAGYLFTQNIEQWRKIMINIDMQIIEELEPLFMQLW